MLDKEDKIEITLVLTNGETNIYPEVTNIVIHDSGVLLSGTDKKGIFELFYPFKSVVSILGRPS
jgi:hypothetical protein